MAQVTFPALVREELARARRLHPDPLTGASSQARRMCWASVIREEYEELWEEWRRKSPDDGRSLEELVQLAAMAQRAAENLNLTDRED